MNQEKIILKNLIQNEEFVRLTIPYLQEEYFSDLSEKTIFCLIRDYYLKYKKRPTSTELELEAENLQIKKDQLEKIHKDINEISNHKDLTNYDWLVDTTEKFCRDKAVYNAILNSIKILEGKDKTNLPGQIPDMLSQALAVSFDTNLGHNYTEDYEKQYEYYNQVENRLPCDIEKLNIITNGGIPTKTLSILLAGVHVGKTLSMCHLASSYLQMGKNVLYITLEVSQEEIVRRIDANILNIDISQVDKISKEEYLRYHQNLKKKGCGKLMIREYPTSRANALHFENLMDELELKEGFVPDVVFIDYLNLCTSIRYAKGGAGMYEYVMSIGQELRGLAVQRNTRIISATQLNRQGFNSSEPDLTNTAESFGLPAIADFMVALVTNENLEKLNQLLVIQLKNRFGSKNKWSKFLMGVDRSRMKWYDIQEEVAESEIKPSPIVSSDRLDKFREKSKGLKI